MVISIQEALAHAFAKDDRVKVLHVEEIAAGEALMPAARNSLKLPNDDVPKVRNNVVVVKLFLRTTGPAPDLPHPTAGTDVGMEIWLPAEKSWNDRIRVQIQGGFAGDFRITSRNHFSLGVCSDLESGEIAANLGYVVSSTDGGHVADSVENISYLMNSDGSPNREGWKNIAWQATHLLCTTTKKIVAAYYGRPAKYSYLYGCSTGGRAAYHSAQRFPNDFDGLLVGCPSITQSLLFPSLGHPHIVIQNDLGGERFRPGQLEMISRKALAASDSSITGQHDGYFTDWQNNCYDPTKDPSVISLKDGGECFEDWALSLAQCHALNKIWYGPTIDGTIPDPSTDNGANHERPAHQLWWGKIRGTRIDFADEPRIIVGSHLAVVFRDRSLAPAEWQDPGDCNQNAWMKWSHEEYGQAMLKCQELDVEFEHMDADNVNLQRFQQTGNKILVYHGLADPGVAPQSAVHYYEESCKHTGGLEKTQEFHRLFLIPGMGHCIRSRGTAGNATIPIPSLEDLFESLTIWVEQGEAPNSILAISVDGSVSRPICMYPKMPKYDGYGNVNSASSFSC